MRDRRVVLTGMGVITPAGIGIEPLWTSLLEGRSHVARITAFETTGLPSQIAACCTDFDPAQFLSRERVKRLGRFCQMAVAASKLAIRDAGLEERPRTPTDLGIFVGTSCGQANLIEEQFAIFREKGYRRVHPLLAPMASPQAAASQIAPELNTQGPMLTIMSDCAGGVDSIAWAAREIMFGTIDHAVAGAIDAPLTPLTLVMFNRTGALSSGNDRPEQASRPFDRAHDGFVMAEGGAMFVVETLERAARRGARIYAEFLGVGWGTDPSNEFGRKVSPVGFALAMRNALQVAKRTPGDVGAICAHAPAVPATDVAEACAIAEIFGTYRVPVTSIKGSIGQAFAGGAAVQVATTVQAIARNEIPPTVNCDDPDSACDIDIVHGAARRQIVETALINAHGFGGNNSVLVLGAPPR